MPYPKIKIDLEKIRNNASAIVEKCKIKGISVAGVTKAFSGNKEIGKAFIEAGVSYLADSRVENLKNYKDMDIEKMMLRLPMVSMAEEVVEYADISLNSEVYTIKALGKEAVKKGRDHKVILMVDLGDLREGYYKEDELSQAVGEIINIKGINLVGLGANMTCYGGVIPSLETFKRLEGIKIRLEEEYSIKLDIVSGGNSSSLHLLEDYDLPINNLRIGEAILLGRETAFGRRVQGTQENAFSLQAEVIESKSKPSVPIGQIGKNAFGKVPSFEDKGIRTRTICAIGQQDIAIDGLVAFDKDIIILGASSDHLILDTSDSARAYKVGDIIEFGLTYSGILNLMTSKYISKSIIK